ncbi:MAG: hypothetical protein AAF366_05525 [Pseudomonadota bacterium]
MIRLPRPIRRFLRAEDAAISVEAAIMMPVLVVFAVASYAYFEAFRRSATLAKASYAMSDAVSRQEGDITPEFLEGLHDIFAFVTGSEGDFSLRISQLVKEDGGLKVAWSYATGDGEALTQETLQLHLERIPALQANDRIIAFEASALYAPAFNIGLPIQRAHTIVATPARKSNSALSEPAT